MKAMQLRLSCASKVLLQGDLTGSSLSSLQHGGVDILVCVQPRPEYRPLRHLLYLQVFSVTVNTLSGDSFDIVVSEGLQVSQLRKQIAQQLSHSPSNLKLVASGKTLLDEQGLIDLKPKGETLRYQEDLLAFCP